MSARDGDSTKEGLEPSKEETPSTDKDFAERSREGEALRESQDFNRSVVESSRDCIKILARDGTLLMMTEGGRKMLGIEDMSDYIGKSWIDFWQGEDQISARIAIKMAAAGGVGSLIGMFPRVDGEPRWWDVLVTPIQNAGESGVRLLAVSRDVTDRKRSELNAALLAAINEEIALLTDVFQVLQAVGAKIGGHLNLTSCVFVEVDETSKVVEVTHEWRGDSVPPTVGKHRMEDYFTEDFQKSCHAGETFVVSDTAADPRTDTDRFASLDIRSFLSVPMVRAGCWRFSLSIHRSVPHVWRKDEIELVNELTPRVLAHLERVRAEETSARLAAIVEFSDDAIISKDLNGIINSWNKGAERVFGYTAREAIGQPVTLLMPPDRVSEENGVLERIRRGESIEHYETVRRVKDGRLIDIALTVSPIVNARGEVVGASKIARDITDRKRSEQLLSESEEHFRTMANAINQLAWTARPDGYVGWYNQSWHDYTGLTPGEMDGWAWQSIHDPAELPRLLDSWTAFIASGQPFEMTFPLRGSDGVFRQFLTRVIPLKNSAGQVVQWFGTHTDVDEITRTQQALRENNQRMMLATHATGVGIWEWDIFTNRLHWDTEMFRIYGLAPTEDGMAPFSAWSDAVHPDDLEEQQEALQETIGGRARGKRDYRIYKAGDSECRHIQVVDSIRYNAQGQPQWVVGTNLDITDLKRSNLNVTFLASISEDLLRLAGMGPLMRSLGEKLGEHLGLFRCVFADVDEAAGTAVVIHDWVREDRPSLRGTYPLAGHLSPEFSRAALAGEPLVVRDTATDPRCDAEKLASFQVGSFISLPFIRNQQLSFLLSVHHAEAHDWREDEIELMREVAARFWARLERSRAEEALARAMSESEQQRRLYHTVLSNTPDFIYVFDLNHRFSYINDALLKVYGMTWEEAKGRDWIGLGYEAWHADMHDREIDQVIATKTPIRGEIPFTGTTGRRIYDYIFSPVFDKNGEVEAVAGTTRDITERKQAESAQAAERTVFERIATGGSLGEILDTLLRETEDQSDSGIRCSILLLDEKGNRLLHGAAPSLPQAYNEAMEGLACGRLMGSCGSAAFERKPVFVSDIASDPHWADYRELAAAHGLAACCSMPIFSLEGHVLGTVAMYYSRPHKPGEHDRYLIERANRLAAIIIERKQAEAALAEQTEELLRSDRNKDEFLAMLAHELRNPLAPIRNATEILQNPAAGPAATERARQLISRQTENMSRMIDDLLDVSRITEGKIELRKQTVELQTVLAAATEVVRQGCESHGQTLTVSLPPGPVYLNADATRLEQLFGNLLGNACKYSGTGSHIELVAQVVEGREVVVSVSDNGIGIDPELLPRIFDLFVQSSRTLDRSHGGLGIGLTIVDRLVRLHGGRIEALSEGLGKGCEFVVHLPLSEAPVTVPSAAAVAPSEARSLRVMIVDDNEDAAESMAMLQELRGHRTRVAHHGHDALAIAAEFVPQVVLLDIGLPGMDGFEVARQIRAIPAMKDAFLVALTGYGSEGDRKRGKEAGFDQHLAKPADMNVLGEWLRTL